VQIHSVLKRFIPAALLRARKRRQWAQIRQHYAGLSVAEAFDKIYRSKAWGRLDDEAFYSGFGSDQEFAVPYTEWVTRFIIEHDVKNVVDLGCGDFRVGRLLCAANNVRYVGLDVVPDLISYNQSRFGREGVEFRGGNIIEDELPDGDLCLIRQVLQHLSNEEIVRVLAKCGKYRHLLITEEIYAGRRMRPNYDKPHAPDNRLYDRSGVYLDLPPYSLNHKVVLELNASSESVLRTSLVEGVASASQTASGVKSNKVGA